MMIIIITMTIITTYLYYNYYSFFFFFFLLLLSLLLLLLLYCTANIPTNIVDFKGVDSSIILDLRGGIPRPIGNSLECLSQAMLVGTMLVGRLGVP